MTSAEILATVEANAADPRKAVQALIDAANQAGGKDNVSVVLVEGERFAASSRKSRPAAATSEAPRPTLRGAGSARRGGFLGALASRPAFLLYGILLGAGGLAAWAAYGPPGRTLGWLDRGSRPAPAGVIRVGAGEGGTATISEALAQAGPGQTVEVAPGVYREALQLRAGVALVSRVPRGAVILPPLGSGVPAVTAQGVADARIPGFRIAGDAQAPLQVGIRLADSAVEVDGVEIAGAQTAGIDIAGADRSEVRASFLHDNPGGGVLVEAGAPRLVGNLIAGNGRAPGAPQRPGVELRAGAPAELIDNRFVGNGAGVLLGAPERGEEIFNWNSFLGLSRADAVRAPAPVPPSGRPH